MGGSGSGRWDGHRKRRTVESCARIEVKTKGQVKASWPGGSWRVWVEWRGDVPYLELRGDMNGWKAEESIEMLVWRPRYGGKAYWLLCSHCGKKCRQLFAPPGKPSYRCRECWGLAYESSQEAHRWDRGTAAAMLAPMYAAKGISMRQVEKAMRAEFKAQRR